MLLGVLSSKDREVGELRFRDLMDYCLGFRRSLEALLDQPLHRTAEDREDDDGDDEQDLDLFAVVEHGVPLYSLKR